MDDRGGSGDRDHVPPREAPRRRMRETLLLQGQAKARLDALQDERFFCAGLPLPHCVCDHYIYVFENN